LDGQINTGQKALGAVKWSVLTEVVSRAVTPLTFIVLARILTPHEFGLVAISQIAITFCALFWDAGLEKALIRTREPTERAANVVFWINLVLGLVLYGVVFVSASPLASFFNTPAATLVLQILGLQIIIGSLTTVQNALLRRAFRFKPIFWGRSLAVVIPAVVAIPMALSGYGIWALVVSSLAGSCANLIFLWLSNPWRPSFTFDYVIAKNMSRFGAWIVLDSLVGWFISQGDSLAVGRFLGNQSLGIYRTGRNIVDMLFGLLLNPLLPLLYPAFSDLQEDKKALRALLDEVNRTIMALTLPVGLGTMCIAAPFVVVVLGEKWQGTEVVLAVLGLQSALGWLVASNPEVYRAVGRPDIQTKIGFMTIPLYVVVYFMAAPHGLMAFVYARLGLTIITIPIHVWMAAKVLGLPYNHYWTIGRSVILSTIFMVVVIQGLNWMLVISETDTSALLELVLTMLAGMASYAGALWYLDKNLVLRLRDIARRSIA
jgi:PST family polysaccharide transporter